MLLGVYDTALPQVDGYLMGRRGRRRIAEELTSETFLAAADAVRRAPPPSAARRTPHAARRTPHAARRTIDVGWVIGVARHRVLMLWRHRFITDQWGWELPGGIVDPGEDATATAARRSRRRPAGGRGRWNFSWTTSRCPA